MKRENFNLTKVKKEKSGTITVDYTAVEVDGAESFTMYFTQKSTKDAHTDLMTKINSLDEFLVKIKGYTTFDLVAGSREFGANEKQKESIKRAVLEIQKRFNITGLRIMGEGEKKRVIITHGFKEDNDQVIGGATHQIYIKNDAYGYEEDLDARVDDIEQEVYEYLFEGKRSQLSLDFTESIGGEDD